MRRPMIGLVALAAVATGLAPTTADAHRRADVDTGRFETLPGAVELGYEISGGAAMLRTQAFGGHTAVVVRVRGLDPNTTYPAHVHNQPCDATPPGGSHYQHTIGGPVDAVNEIWPTVTTGRRGTGYGLAFHDHVARDDARAIVIHYPPDTSIRLACADLS